MKSILYLLSCFLFSFTSFAQNSEYTALNISDSLKENADAIVRLNQVDIIIASQRSMTTKNKRIVTVFNEKGLNAVDAVEYYDKSTTVRNIEAIVYDSQGKEIKKIKRKDFRDQSVISGGTFFSESRYIYLDYTPIQYPFTLVFESEVETSATAFIPKWLPLDNYYTSIEKSVLNVTYPNNLGFKKKEFRFLGFNIKKTTDTATQLSYVATSILAQKPEDYSPALSDISPCVMMGLESFHLEGVDGTATTWEAFGKWYGNTILSGTTDLSDETKAKIKALVGAEIDPVKKAKIVYDYVQKKSRYVNIAVGIGGWKPMLANDVDRLGYGDCKALTNYTKALLQVVDVPSYNTILYGDSYKRDIDSEFVSMQGNHMILSIPNQDNYIWLECTSQDDPFGYQGTFTDDRNVLIIKPEGGEIVRTTIYEDKGNTQISKGNYTLSDDGSFSGTVTIISQGFQYSKKASLENIQPLDKDKYYKNYWDNINNLKINKTVFSNDKENVKFTEDVQISATNYGSISGNKMMFVVDAFNQYTGNVKRIRNRKNLFQIQRGSVAEDEIEIVLPTGFSIEFLPSVVSLKGKYGEYRTEVVKKDNNKLLYKRYISVNKGKYSNTEYDEYRLFMEQINKNDNTKIILTKN
jgi:hypothetical protein